MHKTKYWISINNRRKFYFKTFSLVYYFFYKGTALAVVYESHLHQIPDVDLSWRLLWWFIHQFNSYSLCIYETGSSLSSMNSLKGFFWLENFFFVIILCLLDARAASFQFRAFIDLVCRHRTKDFASCFILLSDGLQTWIISSLSVNCNLIQISLQLVFQVTKTTGRPE